MFNAIRRNGISFIDNNDPRERGVMSESGMMEPLKAERADVHREEWS